MESASQRADENKPLGHESLPRFSPNPRSWSELNPRIPQHRCLSITCFEFRRICDSTRLLVLFPARLCALYLHSVSRVLLTR